jgi:hypothetical protein
MIECFSFAAWQKIKIKSDRRKMQMILKSHLFWGVTHQQSATDGRTGPQRNFQLAASLAEKSCALRNNVGPRINSACGAHPEPAAEKGQQEVAEKKNSSVRESGWRILIRAEKEPPSAAFSRWGCGFSMNMQNTITKAQWSNA